MGQSSAHFHEQRWDSKTGWPAGLAGPILEQVGMSPGLYAMYKPYYSMQDLSGFILLLVLCLSNQWYYIC